MVSVAPLSAAPSRNEAKELPLVAEVAPGTAVSRKLKPALPAMFCWPKPAACWLSKAYPNFMVWEPWMKLKSSLMAHIGCSVPLYAVLPQPVNSLKLTFGKFTLQSTALGMQTLLFQFWPTLGE